MAQELPVIQAAPTAAILAPEDFDARLATHGIKLLRANAIETLQVNVGKLCNQACKHCHVDASPARTEIMTREVAEQVIEAVRRYSFPTLDITGGAPELNPSFRYLVAAAHALGTHVMVRHNLTVMFEPAQEDLSDFFREHKVEVVSSLPYFLEQQTDAQRGQGVFEKSLSALRRLNAVGYGMEGSGLILNLVYNPVGAFLPPKQSSIEADFKRELAMRYNLSFNRLYTITNMPIRRFLDYLRRTGNEERYMRKLVEAFNPDAVEGLMCRSTLSVDWTGRLYDCDFNQMLELAVAHELPQTIFELDPERFAGRRVMTGAHCFGCTAGAGSSCGGAVAKT
ncbi:MAG TPA: arsenosugar biosynthesis radical SAM (seleno)protein ArsS [Pyrinomonadaceae bacterium]|jgi:radical SAM/Cys-rich protein|nr:arsenosugar biosynthesis radical SAM (seleno)protein ArsS [Pyrinomonadaceae bacterium]